MTLDHNSIRLPVLAALLISLFAPGTLRATSSPNTLADVCAQVLNQAKIRGDLRIGIVFGYKDARPARFVGDRHERLALVQKVLSDCKPGESLCGFKRDPHDADLFAKSIALPEGKTLQVSLSVVHSSVGSDDSSNRSNPFQAWQSSYAEKTFLKGLVSSDVIFYNGHSRFGGGPDFRAPVLLKSGEVDAGHYRKQKAGLKGIQKQIQQSHSDSVLGLFSCSSSQHFLQKLRKSLPKGHSMALISSERTIHYSEALEESTSALSSLLKLQCPEKAKTMRPVSN